MNPVEPVRKTVPLVGDSINFLPGIDVLNITNFASEVNSADGGNLDSGRKTANSPCL